MVTNIPHPPPPRITTARICFPNLHLCLRFQAEIRYTCKLQTDQNSTTSIMKSGSSALFPNHLVRDSPSEVIQPVLASSLEVHASILSQKPSTSFRKCLFMLQNGDWARPGTPRSISWIHKVHHLSCCTCRNDALHSLHHERSRWLPARHSRGTGWAAILWPTMR